MKLRYGVVAGWFIAVAATGLNHTIQNEVDHAHEPHVDGSDVAVSVADNALDYAAEGLAAWIGIEAGSVALLARFRQRHLAASAHTDPAP